MNHGFNFSSLLKDMFATGIGLELEPHPLFFPVQKPETHRNYMRLPTLFSFYLCNVSCAFRKNLMLKMPEKLTVCFYG
jgi:hypothetical protein